MSTTTKTKPRAAGQATQKSQVREIDLKTEIALQPKGSFSFFYEELGKFNVGQKDEFRVGIHAAHHAIYFFIGERIVSVSMIKLCESLAPHAEQLVKEGNKEGF